MYLVDRERDPVQTLAACHKIERQTRLLVPLPADPFRLLDGVGQSRAFQHFFYTDGMTNTVRRLLGPERKVEQFPDTLRGHLWRIVANLAVHGSLADIPEYQLVTDEQQIENFIDKSVAEGNNAYSRPDAVVLGKSKISGFVEATSQRSFRRQKSFFKSDGTLIRETYVGKKDRWIEHHRKSPHVSDHASGLLVVSADASLPGESQLGFAPIEWQLPVAPETFRAVFDQPTDDPIEGIRRRLIFVRTSVTRAQFMEWFEENYDIQAATRLARSMRPQGPHTYAVRRNHRQQNKMAYQRSRIR